MTNTLEVESVFRLPRLLRPGLPSGSSIRRTELDPREQEELINLHKSRRRILNDPTCEDMEIFGAIARQVTSSAAETELAVTLMDPLFAQAAALLKIDIRGELYKYVHPDYLGRVLPRLPISNTPYQLMKLAFPWTKPAGRLKLRQMWESRLLYYMTLQTLGMLFRDDPPYRGQLLSMIDEGDTEDEDDPYEDPATDSGTIVVPEQEDDDFRALMDRNDMEHVIAYLLAHDLIEDVGEDKQWSVYLDPESSFRWTPSSVGTTRRRFKIRVCKIKGHDIVFGIRARRKLLFSRVLKWYSRVGAIGQFTPDQVGVRLIFQTEDDYAFARTWFGRKLGILPGGLAASVNTGTSTSPFASGRFSADRVHLTINERLVELQMMTAEMAANVAYSMGTENDSLYGWRKFYPFLRHLRPVQFYGIDWLDPDVQDKNANAVLADIRARLS
ncbi:hypothetical protein HOI83_03095 [Candidatus Uhrbacteria bacterium]|jgi:hypothetical protein|nr:hypothetical protein [Candidatus Uhrbacteria bacterium]